MKFIMLILSCLSFPMIAEAATPYRLWNDSIYNLEVYMDYADPGCYLQIEHSKAEPKQRIQFTVNTTWKMCEIATLRAYVIDPSSGRSLGHIVIFVAHGDPSLGYIYLYKYYSDERLEKTEGSFVYEKDFGEKTEGSFVGIKN